MTSFGATDVVKFSGFQSTFKVQGQVYHLHGSLLLDESSKFIDESSKFLQIYFIGDENLETDQRCSLFENIEREKIWYIPMAKYFHCRQQHDIYEFWRFPSLIGDDRIAQL